jgi:hypothetical protein
MPARAASGGGSRMRHHSVAQEAQGSLGKYIKLSLGRKPWLRQFREKKTTLIHHVQCSAPAGCVLNDVSASFCQSKKFPDQIPFNAFTQPIDRRVLERQSS